MSVGSKPEIFHSDDITSEYLEESLPGRPVGMYNKLLSVVVSRDPL